MQNLLSLFSGFVELIPSFILDLFLLVLSLFVLEPVRDLLKKTILVVENGS